MGQGNWATISWIALLDNRETDSTQRGVHGFYLALAQGVTESNNSMAISKAENRFRARAKGLRQHCQALTQPDLRVPTEAVSIFEHSLQPDTADLGRHWGEAALIVPKYLPGTR